MLLSCVVVRANSYSYLPILHANRGARRKKYGGCSLASFCSFVVRWTCSPVGRRLQLDARHDVVVPTTRSNKKISLIYLNKKKKTMQARRRVGRWQIKNFANECTTTTSKTPFGEPSVCDGMNTPWSKPTQTPFGIATPSRPSTILLLPSRRWFIKRYGGIHPRRDRQRDVWFSWAWCKSYSISGFYFFSASYLRMML